MPQPRSRTLLVIVALASVGLWVEFPRLSQEPWFQILILVIVYVVFMTIVAGVAVVGFVFLVYLAVEIVDSRRRRDRGIPIPILKKGHSP
jgi:hypothetical protein